MRRSKVFPEEFATIDERCESLARQFDLTEREVEVMKLPAKGRSKSFIAEELYLSENTARATPSTSRQARHPHQGRAAGFGGRAGIKS